MNARAAMAPDIGFGFGRCDEGSAGSGSQSTCVSPSCAPQRCALVPATIAPVPWFNTERSKAVAASVVRPGFAQVATDRLHQLEYGVPDRHGKARHTQLPHACSGGVPLAAEAR